jgi:hypothetical protein
MVMSARVANAAKAANGTRFTMRAAAGLALLVLGACHADAPGDVASEASVAPGESSTQGSALASASSGLRLPDRGPPGQGANGDIAIGAATVQGDGPLPVAADATLASSRPQVRFCFLRASQMDPTMHGHIVLDLSVTSAGTVPEVSIVSNSGNLSEAVGRCLVRRMKSLSFTTEHGIGAVLRVPFDFTSSYDGGVLPEAGGPLPTQMLVLPAGDSGAHSLRGAGQGGR